MTDIKNILSKSNLPLVNDISDKRINDKSQNVKKKRRDKSDLGDNFIPPDGGWGWIVAIAAGLDILVVLAPEQNFGILYKKRLFDLGISNTQIATIINIDLTMSYITGLFNGALFRRFTFRQIALFAGVLMFVGSILEVFADSFILFLISYSLFYGTAEGLIISATSMAVNTYFLRNRRSAVAYQWGVGGLGPIFFPFIVTQLVNAYGVQGTALLKAAFSLHTLACGLIFQPVKWHVKKPEIAIELESPQKLEEVETPIFTHSIPTRSRLNSMENYECVFANAEHKKKEESQSLNSQSSEKLPFYKNVIIFFDLDLLRDFTFVIIFVGLALLDFVDLNFVLLTPFILSDFGYNDNQTATVMTVLGICDLFIRFSIPVVTKYMKLNNQAVCSFGAVGLCIGRLALTFTGEFWILGIVFLWMGFNRAVRIVFSPLIIPDYVPLKRLPAATGLHLFLCSIFSFLFGSIVGLIRDKSNYVVTINFLNGLACIALVMWFVEAYLRSVRNKKICSNKNANNC